ncbi:MAG: hypothetical protein U0586_14830 [Candidatus Brocadiaceae bacterium]
MSEEDKAIVVEDQNGNKMTLNDSGIKIESSKDIVMKAAKDIKIEGMNIDLKAQTAFKAARNSQRRGFQGEHDIKGKRHNRDTGRGCSNQLIRQ